MPPIAVVPDTPGPAPHAALLHRQHSDAVQGRFDFARRKSPRVTETVTRIKLGLPTVFPYQADFSDLAARIAKIPS